MARVDGLYVYPIKALSGISVEQSTVLPGGTLEHDREYAIVDAEGDTINGKRTPSVHPIDLAYDPATGQLRLDGPDRSPLSVTLPAAVEPVERWLADHFGVACTLVRDTRRGFVDRRDRGPSIVSLGTLREIASWFPALTPESVRRRLRPNIVIEGVPAFWEDGLLAADRGRIDIDGLTIEAAEACGRCVVPERDPDTGTGIDDFRERFIKNRRRSLPAWISETTIDHYYTAMVIGSVPSADRGRTITVDDRISVPADAHPLGPMADDR